MKISSINKTYGNSLLDIPEQRELRSAFSLYFGHPYPQRNTLTKNRLWNALNAYIQFCIDYFTSELCGRTPSPDEVAPALFVVDFDNLQQYKRFLKVAIYAACEYAKDLQSRLKISELATYEELILTIESDFENLILDYEQLIKNENKDAQHTINSRNYHLICDGKWAAQSMVFIEHELSSRKPDFRGIRPYSLFIDRQCLEIAGNNLLGFYKIIDQKGSDIHKYTQVGWKFLADRNNIPNDVKGWSVDLPFKVETIRALVSWSNSFVHKMRFYNSYIQHYAMDMMWRILQPTGQVETAIGPQCKFEHGAFFIENYRNMKRDFEHYVKVENGNKSATIVWKPLYDVGAYIKSLGQGKVLYLMHMPPPVHGASMVGKYIMESELLQNRFDGEYINITTATELNDIGRFGIKKGLRYFIMLHKIRQSIKKDNPHIIYITPNAAGRPFYKDLITVCFIKLWSGYSLFECKWPLKIVWNYKKRKTVNKIYRRPNILVHYHNKGVKEYSKSKLNNWLYKIFFKDLYVLLLSPVLYDDVKKYVPVSRAGFCENGLPVLSDEQVKCVFDNIRQKNKEKSAKPINILYLSNMMEEKGVWTLVDACKILKDNGLDFRCTFVGGWKDITAEIFSQKINSLELNANVFAVGAKYGAEKEQYWLDADVFVFPTYYHNECFPLVLLEAMQHALPCLSTKEGAIPDIIDDSKTGYLINSKNARQLAARITDLINDKCKRIEMGIEGYRKFKKYYTLDMFEKRIYNVLEQLI